MNGGIINSVTRLHLVGCFYWTKQFYKFMNCLWRQKLSYSVTAKMCSKWRHHSQRCEWYFFVLQIFILSVVYIFWVQMAYKKYTWNYAYICTYIYSLSSLCILNIILPACRPSLFEVARTTWKVERAYVRSCRSRWCRVTCVVVCLITCDKSFHFLLPLQGPILDLAYSVDVRSWKNKLEDNGALYIGHRLCN
jgi:hypothetical protein